MTLANMPKSKKCAKIAKILTNARQPAPVGAHDPRGSGCPVAATSHEHDRGRLAKSRDGECASAQWRVGRSRWNAPITADQSSLIRHT